MPEGHGVHMRLVCDFFPYKSQNRQRRQAIIVLVELFADVFCNTERIITGKRQIMRWNPLSVFSDEQNTFLSISRQNWDTNNPGFFRNLH